MSRPSSQRPRGCDIPQEDLLVPSHAGETRIVLGDGDVEDFISVGRVCLNESRTNGGAGRFGRVVEAD